MKAIELVARAQPIVEAFRQIASQSSVAKRDAVVESCDKWLDAARELLEKKGKVEK